MTTAAAEAATTCSPAPTIGSAGAVARLGAAGGVRCLSGDGRCFFFSTVESSPSIVSKQASMEKERTYQWAMRPTRICDANE